MKRGRPKSNNRKDQKYSFRTDLDILEKLNSIAIHMNISKSKALETCIRLVYYQQKLGD